MTAATVRAGGPPTQTFTRSGSPRRDGGGMVHADAAVNLVVEPDFAIRHVLLAGELHAVHAQVRLSQAGPVGVFGINQWQGHEGPAVIGPALDLRELVECGLVGEDRSI